MPALLLTKLTFVLRGNLIRLCMAWAKRFSALTSSAEIAVQFGGSTNEGDGGKCRRQKVSTSFSSDFQKLDNDAKRKDRQRKLSETSL